MIYVELFLTRLGGRRLNYLFLSTNLLQVYLEHNHCLTLLLLILMLHAVERLLGCLIKFDCLLQVKSIGQLKKHN